MLNPVLTQMANLNVITITDVFAGTVQYVDDLIINDPIRSLIVKR